LLEHNYAKEIWALYEDGNLNPESELSGYFEEDTTAADVDTIMLEIKAALAEEEERLRRISEEEEL
jgi:RIO kinase 1